MDTAGHESVALCPLYTGSYSSLLLQSFIRLSMVRILETLQTEQVMFAGFLISEESLFWIMDKIEPGILLFSVLSSLMSSTEPKTIDANC